MPNSSPEYINETKNTMGSIQLPDARHYVGIGGSEVPYGEDGQDPSDRFKMKWRYDANMHETDNSPPQSPTKQPAGCYNYSSIQWSRLKYDDRTKIIPECENAFDVNTSSFYEGFTNINQRDYKDDYTIICARYNKNTDFLDDLSDKFDVKIVQKRINEPYDQKYVDHLVINKANEATSYLSYIVKYYHNLPNNMIFIHDENTSWHHSGKITENIKNWIKEYKKTDGYFEVNNKGCNNECKEYFKSKEYKDILHHLLPNFNLDAHKFDGKCCAQFIVSKKRVQGNLMEFYVRFLHWLIEHTQGEGNGDPTNFHSGFQTSRYAEWLWKLVFTHPPQSATKQPAGCYNYPLSDTKHPTQPPSSFTAWFKKYEVIIVISAIALIAVIMMWFKYILFLINQI